MNPLVLGVIAGGLYLLGKGYRVTVKNGVILTLSPRMWAGMPGIDRASFAAIGRGAIITSGADGRHSKGSKHYTGDAVDLRTRDLTAAQKQSYAVALDNELNSAGHVYDVLIEDDHIHIEVDPKPYRMGPVRI